MALALHRGTELRGALQAQCMMQLRQERRDRIPDEDSVARTQELHRGLIGEFDKSTLIHRYDSGRAGFDQTVEPRLPLDAKPAIPRQFRHEQAAANERERFEAQPYERSF